MTHLLFFLLRGQSGLPFAVLVLVCLAGGIGATTLLSGMAAGSVRRRLGCVAAFAIGGTGFNVAMFLLGLASGFPQLRLRLPLDSVVAALAISLLCDGLACVFLLFGRRSMRRLLLAAAMNACGTSLTVFTGMAALVRPFRLAYDLGIVVCSGACGVMLCAFAFHEIDRPGARRPGHPPVILFALATLAVSLGSLGSILPFDRWVNIMDGSDSLSAFPVSIVLAVNLNLAIAMALTGWGIDSLLARQEQRQVARVRRLADSSFEGVLIHRDARILDANETLLRMSGHTMAELRLMRVDLLVAALAPTRLGPTRGAPATGAPTAEALRGVEPGGVTAPGGSIGPVVAEILTRDGERLPVELLSREIDYVGGPARVVALRDMRERREAENRIHYLANHDALTNLPNRRQLELRFEQALASARSSGSRMAVCCIDLDGFKAINDRLGHAAGDLLLLKVADVLRTGCDGDDLAARFGGDEFVLVLEPGDRSERAAELGERLVCALSIPFDLDGVVASIGASIGISFFPDDGDCIDSLFKTADIALYRAKERGRNQVCLFESAMDRRVLERRALEQDLRQAIASNSLSLHYQPLFDAARQIVAFEALLRWTHPELGSIPPDRFIPIAERCGLILQLGDWVLRSACREAAGWDHGCRVAVNLSPAQFRHGSLIREISQALAESGLPPERLELEVTEGVLIDDTTPALPILTALRERGVRVVLDDFGTGYSSLGYLHNFTFDKIKIDRSFIERIENDRKALTIVDAIIAMSHKLNLVVTAEGIETGAQLSMLQRQGCDEMQGFLLGRPMQASMVPEFLRAHARGEAPAAQQAALAAS